MLDDVRSFLQRGQRDRALDALREALLEFCAESFVRGDLRHPLAASRAASLLAGLRSLAALLVPDPARSRAAVLALESVERAIRDRAVGDETLDRLNFALQVLLPDVALVLAEALQNARFQLGAAASNVEDPGAEMARVRLPWQADLLVELADAGMRAMQGGRLDRLQALSLRDLDPLGDDSLEICEDLFGFGCPDCGKEISAALESVGAEIRCGSGHPVRVPRPSLERMAEGLKARRDAARGISKCRICGGVIQVGKGGVMRVGFCSLICAAQARTVLGEFVAPEGIREGDDVCFRCHCGASMTVPLTEVGTKMSCLSCPLEVWVPEAARPEGRRKELLSCAKCRKPVKSTAVKCLYCGTPVS